MFGVLAEFLPGRLARIRYKCYRTVIYGSDWGKTPKLAVRIAVLQGGFWVSHRNKNPGRWQTPLNRVLWRSWQLSNYTNSPYLQFSFLLFSLDIAIGPSSGPRDTIKIIFWSTPLRSKWSCSFMFRTKIL